MPRNWTRAQGFTLKKIDCPHVNVEKRKEWEGMGGDGRRADKTMARGSINKTLMSSLAMSWLWALPSTSHTCMDTWWCCISMVLWGLQTFSLLFLQLYHKITFWVDTSSNLQGEEFWGVSLKGMDGISSGIESRPTFASNRVGLRIQNKGCTSW